MSSLTRHILELPPSGLTVSSPNQSQLDIAWTRNPRAQYYVLYMDGAYIASVTNPNYGVAGLGSNETHFFEVASVGLADGLESARSGRVFGTTQTDSIAPTQPGVITFSNITSSGFTASWGASTDAVGVAGYEYSFDSVSYLNAGAATSSNFTGKAASTTFTLAIRAYDAAGNRSTPRTGTVTTQSGAAPTSGLQIDGGSIVITPGQTAAVTQSLGFTPTWLIVLISGEYFYVPDAAFGSNTAFPLHDTTLGCRDRAVGWGAFDGTRQRCTIQAARWADGRRDGDRWNDCIFDGGQFISGSYSALGPKFSAAFGAGSFTINIDRASAATDGTFTIQWMAGAGCNAYVGDFNVPGGTYGARGPFGVAVTGIPFAPKGGAIACWKDDTSPIPSFPTATNGSGLGFLSNSGGTIRQGAVGSQSGYDSLNWSMAYDGCLAGPDRTDRANPLQMAAATGFTSDGWVMDFDAADNGGLTNYNVPFIAFDCECYAGIQQINSGAGTVTISGAPFQPVAGIVAAVPSQDQKFAVGVYPGNISFDHGNSINTTLGFFCNTASGLKQGGVAYFDQGGYSSDAVYATGFPDIIVNGWEKRPGYSGSTHAHDASSIAFSDALMKGQQRTGYDTFAVNAAVAVSAVSSNGVVLNQTSGSGRPGYFAYLLLGSSQPDLGLNANLRGKRLFSSVSELHRDITSLGIDAKNAAYHTALANQAVKVECFGWISGGAKQGFPYYVVDSTTQPLVDVVVGGYPGDSIIVRAPIPLLDSIVQDYPNNPLYPAAPSGADCHVLVIDRAKWVSYEMYKGHRRGDHWYCSDLVTFDLNGGDDQIPYTSGHPNAAGISLLGCLLRTDEINRGVIDHAIGFAPHHIDSIFFTAPAMSSAGNSGANYLPSGSRMRLRSDFPETGNFPSTAYPISASCATIIRAMKKYGIVATDSEGAHYLALQGDSAGSSVGLPSLDVTEWAGFFYGGMSDSDFTVVASPNPVYQDGKDGSTANYPTGALATASLTVSANEINTGSPVTVTPTVSGHKQAHLVPIGGFLSTVAPVVESPTKTRWYTLTAVNQFGVKQVHKRVIVADEAHRYATYDRYVSPTGSTSNTGLTAGSPWPLSVVVDPNYTWAIAGQVIGLLDGTYSVSTFTNPEVLVNIPGGANGRPTVLQAVNSRQAIIDGGASTIPVIGRYYNYCSHIQLIGLKVQTSAAGYCAAFYGGFDTGILIDDCEFTGMSAAAILMQSGAYTYAHSGAFIRACKINGTGKYLARLGGTTDTHFRGNVLGANSLWDDYGNNTPPVID